MYPRHSCLYIWIQNINLCLVVFNMHNLPVKYKNFFVWTILNYMSIQVGQWWSGVKEDLTVLQGYSNGTKDCSTLFQDCFKDVSRMLHACLADARGKFKDALDLLKYSIRLLNGAWREPLGFFPLTCSESLVLKYDKNNQKLWGPTWNWVDIF